MKKPSISELLKLLDKPALLNWANKQGLAGIDITKARKEWQNNGTSLHAQIEGYVKHKEPFLNESHTVAFDNFMKGKSVIDLEVAFETEWFTGRYDMICHDGGSIRMIDFKSNQKGIYIENKLQLIAYSMYQKCDCFSIVSIPDFIQIDVEIKDRKPYEEILKSLSTIYTNKKILEYAI